MTSLARAIVPASPRFPQPRWLAAWLLPSMLFIASCAAFRPTPVPIRQVEITAAPHGHCLVVLLPGRFSKPEDFSREGFAEAVATRELPIDLIAVDAHLGYYRKRTVIDRLHTDVIAPARAAGYESVWLVGTSLGGLGTLLYLRDHPDDLSGAIALAPFLGKDDAIQEITAAGGPTRWKPPANIASGDVGRELWSWLVSGERNTDVPLYLGWGSKDNLGPANRLLAELLPAERVLTIEGGHDMPTWKRLWGDVLDRGEVCGGRP